MGLRLFRAPPGRSQRQRRRHRLPRRRALRGDRRSTGRSVRDASKPRRSFASWIASFGEAGYSIASLFRDLQRQVLKKLFRERLTVITEMYQRVFDSNLPLMRFLQHLSAPIPMPLHATAEVLFNSDLRWALKDDDPDFDQITQPGSRGADLESPARQQGTRLPAHQDARPRGPALAGSARSARTTERPRLRRRPGARASVRAQPLDAAERLLRGARSRRSTKWPSRRPSNEAAAKWVDEFLSLGEKLGIVVEAGKKKAMSCGPVPGSSSWSPS